MSTPILAITGNIGSGKTTAAKILQAMGACRIDADQLARDIVAPGTPALAQIRDFFGEDILTQDGQLDRKALGAIVFDDSDARKQLEAITHPQIRMAMMQAILAAQQQGPPLIVLEIPLLFEGGMQHQFPNTLLITADDATRLRRIMTRDGIDAKEAKARLDSQMPQADKIALATWVIANNADSKTLEEQLEYLWPEFTSSAVPADN